MEEKIFNLENYIRNSVSNEGITPTELLGLQKKGILNDEENPLTGSEQQLNQLKEENLFDGNYRSGRWENDEHIRFLKGCLMYGNNWKKVNTKIYSY